MKTVSEKKIWIRNVGGSCARFSVLVQSPFDVQPKRAILTPDETMHLTFSFKPIRCDEFKTEMLVRFESGEKLCVKLAGRAFEADICLEKRKLLFSDTYEGLSNQKCIKLYNNSDYVLEYKWKLHSTAEFEQEAAENLKNKWRDLKDYESLRGNKLETFEVIDYAGHRKVYDRIYCDEIEEFESNDQFLYRHKDFKIEPIVRKHESGV